MSIPRNLSIHADTLNSDGNFTSITDTGNLTFTGTGNRITGDFSNATGANRVTFQTSTLDGQTDVQAIPNGTGTRAGFIAYNNSSIGSATANTQLLQLSTETRLVAGGSAPLPMTFYAGGSEAMRIAVAAGGIRAVGIGYTTLTGVGDNGLAVLGNVGIGTSSPVRKLDLRNTSADYQLHLGDTASTTLGYELGRENTAGLFKFYGNQTGATGYIFSGVDGERMRIDTSGIVTMSAYGAGAATFSAAGVISSVSDETWKIKDGVPVDPDAMLKKLEPGYWYYNDEKKETFGVDRQLGFYAQNVNAAIGPEAAPTPEEGKPWGYYDRSVLAVAVMSLQKALATIESLTARITALESKEIS